MKAETPELLHLLMEHELALKHLYEAFAASFSRHREFWQDLARDEQAHSDKLESLTGEPGLQRWVTQPSQIKPQAVRSSLDYVDAQKEKAHQGGFTPLQALVVAKDLEDALIDRLGLLPPPTGCAGVEPVIAELRAETDRHRQALAETLQAERRPGG